MRTSSIARQRTPASVRTGKSASLSVVVVSAGSAVDGQKAAAALSSASSDFHAQLIFVSRAADPRFVAAVERNGGEFIHAPMGSTRAEMCDLGMGCALGSIVAVRDDVAVGDASWMEVYRSVLPRRESPRVEAAEALVMDSLVAGRVQLADVVGPVASDFRARNVANEMAAAV